MTRLEAKQDLARKLNISLTDIANNDLFSAADLESWISSAAQTAWDRYRWSFTEGSKDLVGGVGVNEYYDYPEDFENDSIFLLRVAGKQWKELRFEAYRKYLEDNSSGKDKVWATYKRFYFLNQNACSIGDDLEIWGKLRYQKMTQDSDRLPFAPDTDNQENSGNQAIIRLSYGYALSSEKLKQPQRGQAEEVAALAMIDRLWAPEAARLAQAQFKDQAMFEVPQLF